jgi:hypothetical protein
MRPWSFLAVSLLAAGPGLADDPPPADATPAPTTADAPPSEPPAPTTADAPPPAPTSPPTDAPPPEAPPAPAEAPPPAPAAAPSVPSTATADPAGDAGVSAEVPAGPRFGEPTPLTRREPTLRAGTLMVGARYGLVGNGPTRFVDDVRYAFTDRFELRTALLPWPTSLMGRYRFGGVADDLGAFVVDGGLSYFDAGVRIVPDSGEANVGVRFHFEGIVSWQKSIGDRLATFASVRYRNRTSLLPDDDQHAVAVDASVAYDLLDNLAVSGGLGFASTIGGPVREVVVNFTETDRAGISHLLARDEGGQQSVTVPLTLTYGRVDTFDVDLFVTPRVFPEFGVLFGAGVRLRLEDLFGS